MDDKMKKALVIMMCMALSIALLTACGSEAKKEMKATVETAMELIEKGETPYDASTKDALEEAIAGADEAKDDEAYSKVTQDIQSAMKAYEDSVKQLQQVTNPEEKFLIERAKSVDSVTDVEAATEETDANNMMNKPGGYTSYIAMRSSLVKDEIDYYKGMSPVEAGNDGGAVIEAYPTVKDAEDRDQYLASLDGSGPLSPGTHKVVGTLVVRTSSELTASQQKELEKKVVEALIRLED